MARRSTESLETILSTLNSLDVDALVTNPMWGAITFVAARDDLETIRNLAGVLSGVPLSRIPSHALPLISRAFESANETINRLRSFNLQSGGNPVDQQNQILGAITSSTQELHNQLHQWLPYVAYLHGDIPQQLSAIATAVGSTQGQAADFENFVEITKEAVQKDLADIVSAVRETSGKEGVAHFADDFKEDAKAREADASRWLAISLVAAVVTLAVATAVLFVVPPESTVQAVHLATSKIIILGLLLGVTAWCAGNYKANKHQAVISRRKEHALRTFRAFVQASDNPAIRDAVLVETTRFIFSHAHTGYVKADGAAEAPSQIIEIIKGSTATDGK